MEEGKSKRVGKVVDLIKYRKNKNDERRREYERTLFNRLLGVYSFVETDKLRQVEIIDLSLNGIKFREEYNQKRFEPREKINIRFYCTPSSFLKVIATIKRLNEKIENGKKYIEYGCEIDNKTKSYEALKQLVCFMQKYSEIACPDSNPPIIWF